VNSYFIRTGGRIVGPFPGRHIREMASAGRLKESDEVSSDRVRWVPARDIPTLVFQAKTPVRVEQAASVSVIAPTPSQPPVVGAAPVIQMHAAPVIHVNTPVAHGNSLGIASMVLGILAFLICWIPFLNLLGLPLSALGLLLGIIGIIVTATRGGSGAGFPIAGTAISGLALVIVIWMYVAIASAMAPRVPNQQTQPTSQPLPPPVQGSPPPRSGRNATP
jgi:hypothetical protein